MRSVLVALLLLGSSLSAALPPIYESVREIKAILDDRQLAEALQSVYPIVRIERTADGYIVESSRGDRVAVTLTYQPVGGDAPLVGPSRFSLSFRRLP